MRHGTLLLSLVGILGVTTLAGADIPPPPDSPDAHCSASEQCSTGSVSCPYAFNPGRPPPPGEQPVGADCRARALARGMERRCRSGSNYSGDELFCPPGTRGSWRNPHDPHTRAFYHRDCSVGHVGATGAPSLATVLAALVGLRRRRRR